MMYNCNHYYVGGKSMANKDRNCVLSGKYAGKALWWEKDWVFIEWYGVFFSSASVSSVTMVGKQDGPVAAGAFYAGVPGAIVASAMGTDLLEVTWKDGNKSIIQCDTGLTKDIIASPYKSPPPEETRKRMVDSREKQQENWAAFQILFWVVLIIIILAGC